MLPYDKLISFNEYSRLTLDDYNSAVRESFDPLIAMQTSPFEKQEDDILHLIFAPDPFTGTPRSDLAIMMSKDTAPEVARYIQDVLHKPLPDNGPSGAPDPDTALDTLRNRGESFTDYADRIRSLAACYEKTSKDD